MTANNSLAAQSLYSRDILRLAMTLSEWPYGARLPGRAELRSSTCGSRVVVELALDDRGRIAEFGIDAQACALGQASAAILAGRVVGRSRDDIATGLAALTDLLDGRADSADVAKIWPGLDALASAQGLSARRPSILLPFRATIQAIDRIAQNPLSGGQ